MDSRQRSRSRSQSPIPDHHRHHRHHRRDRDRDRSSKHHRTHSPDRERERRRRHHHHHHRHHDDDRSQTKQIILPFQARELAKRDLPAFKPMFAMYLDIQKGIIIEDLSEEDVKGRWKSFVNKWNRGELAEGWYDPSTLAKARSAADDNPGPSHPPHSTRETAAGDEEERGHPTANEEDGDDDDEEYGPNLPTRQGTGGHASGPTIPTMQDLEIRKEDAVEEAREAHRQTVKHNKAERRAHLAEKRDVEDEVAPRAEPGTHERRMEKRRDTAAANRAFAESRRGGSPTDAAPDEELMGSGENDLEALRKAQAQEQRKKNEREIRREEILRARAAEREERVQRYREKEEETIGWLKTLAKQRFG